MRRFRARQREKELIAGATHQSTYTLTEQSGPEQHTASQMKPPANDDNLSDVPGPSILADYSPSSPEDHSLSEAEMTNSETSEMFLTTSGNESEMDSDVSGEGLGILQDKDVHVEESSFQEKLCYWATQHRQTRDALTDLLVLLINEGHVLPRDSRTLLQTMRSVPTTVKAGGTYLYLGVQNMVQRYLPPDFNASLSAKVFMKINVDGIPVLFKSSGHD